MKRVRCFAKWASISVFLFLVTFLIKGTVSVEAEEVFSYGNYNYTVSGGEATIVQYTGTDASITFPDSINGYPVTTLAQRIFQENTTVERVKIPKSIVKCHTVWDNGIVYGPLSKCESLTEVEFEEGAALIPGGVCKSSNVSSVTIPDTVVEIGDNAFSGSKIYAIRIPDGVETIGKAAFDRCSDLESISLPNSLTKMQDRLMADCGKLRFCTIPESVIEMEGNIFLGCKSLETLTLPHKLSTIGDQIIKGTQIEKIVVPKSVNKIYTYYYNDITYGPFSGCETLNTVEFEDGIEVIPDSVCRNSRVRQVIIPESVTTIENYAFASSQVESVEIPYGVRKIKDSVFQHCGELTEVKLPESLQAIGSGAFRYCRKLEAVDMKGPVAAVEDETFFCCEKMTSCVISDSAERIGRSAFEGCSSLSSLTLPDNLKTIGDSFVKGTQITSLRIPAKVKTFERRYWNNINYRPFSGCTTLHTVIFEDGMQTIPEGACTFENITKIVIPDSVIYIDKEAFRGTGITSVEFPSGLKKIGADAFHSCKNLKSIELTDRLQEIGVAAFEDCSALESIVLGESKERPMPAIIDATAEKGEKEGTINLQWSLDEKLYQIKNAAFKNCSSLSTITFSAEIGNVEEGAFSQCAAIEKVKYCGSPADWKKVTVTEKDNTNLLAADLAYGCADREEELGCEISISVNPKFSLPQNEEIVYEKAEKFQETIKLKETARKYYIKICTYRENKKNGTRTYGHSTEIKLEGPVSAEEVKERVERFHELLKNYVNALNTEAKAGKRNYKSSGNTMGMMLRKADEGTNDKLVTLFPGDKLTEEQIDSIYAAVAEYISTVVSLELNDIDASQVSPEEAALSITKEIQENATENSGYRSFKTESGTVRIHVYGTANGYFGTVKIGAQQVAEFQSTIEKTNKALEKYVENLSDVANKLMYQSLASIFTELAEVTGVPKYLEKDLEELLKGKETWLRDAGFGNLMNTGVAIQKGAKILKDIQDASNETDLLKALETPEKIWKEIEELDFSDKEVDKVLMSEAIKELEAQREDVAKALYAYTYGTEMDEPASWIGKKIKKLQINCPVDFVIYDEDGNEIGNVKNGTASFTPALTILVNGDTKTVWMDGEKSAKIRFTGTGTGVMNYTMQDIQNAKVTGQVNYYDIPLTRGSVYTQGISGGSLLEGNNQKPVVPEDGSDSISPGGVFSPDVRPENVEVSCDILGKGVVEGCGTYEKGDTVEITAKAEDGYYFDGWYEGDELLETSESYYFAAVKDIALEARFTKKTVVSQEYGATVEEKYQTTIGIFIVEEDGQKKLVFNSLDASDSSLDVTLKKYESLNRPAAEETVSLKREEGYRYILEDLNMESCVKVEVYDTSGDLIGEILKDELQPQSIFLNKKQTALYVGGGETLTAGITPAGAYRKLRWSSSHPDIVSVSQTGRISARKAGNAEVTVMTHNGLSASCAVRVSVKPAVKVSSIKLEGISKKIAAGKKFRLTPKIYPSNAANKNLIWKSSNQKYAKVSASGKVTTYKKGAGKYVTITAFSRDGSGKKATYKIKIMKGVVKKVSISGKKSVKAGKTLKLKGKVKATSKANKKLKWKSSNTKYAKVTSSGKVKTYKAGKRKKVKITAYATDGSGKKKTVTIKIK